MSGRRCWVYIMANPWTHVLYAGVTGDLIRRVFEHKEKAVAGFTQRYNITSLVYFEEHNGPRSAIAREKQIKGWSRQKKLELIYTLNPGLHDLSEEWSRSDAPETVGGQTVAGNSAASSY